MPKQKYCDSVRKVLWNLRSSDDRAFERQSKGPGLDTQRSGSVPFFTEKKNVSDLNLGQDNTKDMNRNMSRNLLLKLETVELKKAMIYKHPTIIKNW